MTTVHEITLKIMETHRPADVARRGVAHDVLTGERLDPVPDGWPGRRLVQWDPDPLELRESVWLALSELAAFGAGLAHADAQDRAQAILAGENRRMVGAVACGRCLCVARCATGHPPAGPPSATCPCACHDAWRMVHRVTLDREVVAR